MAKTVTEAELNEILKTKPKGVRIIFRFLMSPVKLNGEDGKIKSVEFVKNELKVLPSRKLFYNARGLKHQNKQ